MRKRRCNIIAPNIVIPFDGNHADIPSGYTRETSLDSKYIKGTAAATNPNTTGGASTHTHTGTASHTHTLNSHTHTGTLGTPSGSTRVAPKHSSGHTTEWNHTHTFTSGGSSGGTTNSTTANYAACSNDPPYYTVIFIKASGYSTIPNSAMVFSASTSRSGFSFHTASANKFLKGAATSANAGSTGGSTTNVHNINHTHTTNTHTHTSVNSSGATAVTRALLSDNSGEEPPSSHVHSVSIAAGTQALNAYTNLTTTETVEPAYRTLNAFKNESGSSVMPAVGDIALWLGTLATIPVGWKLCDGSDGTPDMRGRYYKNPSSASSTSTGGSNTHSHAAQGHSHTSNGSHTHSGSSGYTSSYRSPQSGSAVTIPHKDHNHVVTVNSTTATYASGNTAANSSSNEPEYRTVAFIQFEFPPVMPNPILKMLIDTVENWG